MNDSSCLSSSNTLTDLAARIKAEHQAVSVSLKESVAHAIQAGTLLLEAKAEISHGQWLPWLRDQCTLSERTAQLYMRTAKNRTTIEEHIRTADADLSLNEVTALLMMTSDMRKILAFTRDCEHLSGEELINRCIAEGVGVIVDESYDPFYGRSETEISEWWLFVMFLSYDPAAPEATLVGYAPQDAFYHVEYLLQRPFQNVAEWLGEEGDKWRESCFFPAGAISDGFKSRWASFLAEHRHLTLEEIRKAADELKERFDRADAEGRLPRRRKKRIKSKES